MKRFFKSLGIATLLFGFVPLAASAQDGATQTQIERRDPDFCGAGGAGCDSAEVQQWKAVGTRACGPLLGRPQPICLCLRPAS